MKEKVSVINILLIVSVLLITVNCSMGQILNTTTSTATIKATSTKELTSTKTATQIPAFTATSKPFDLIGIWKTDDMRAPDSSWKITYPIYLKFTNNKQSVYHGMDAFNTNKPTDEGDLVYINESTFIKKIVYIPSNQELIGKYQKWTWSIVNGKALFVIYSTLNSQELALSDTIITGLSTGIKVEK
jgi:hypothetical protein